MEFCTNLLRKLVYISAAIAGAALLSMMLVTCVDIIMRKLGHPFTGAYDLVKIAAGLTCACALPYTTALKGHVAVEFFFRRMGRRGQIITDTLIRTVIIALFSLFTWHLVQHGLRLRDSKRGEHDPAIAGVLGPVRDGGGLCPGRLGNCLSLVPSGQSTDQNVTGMK